MRDYGHQAVVLADGAQPGRRARAARRGRLAGLGVLGPEAFPAEPFLELLADYGAPHGTDERRLPSSIAPQ